MISPTPDWDQMSKWQTVFYVPNTILDVINAFSKIIAKNLPTFRKLNVGRFFAIILENAFITSQIVLGT